jgi:hypothetical protein
MTDSNVIPLFGSNPKHPVKTTLTVKTRPPKKQNKASRREEKLKAKKKVRSFRLVNEQLQI